MTVLSIIIGWLLCGVLSVFLIGMRNKVYDEDEGALSVFFILGPITLCVILIDELSRLRLLNKLYNKGVKHGQKTITKSRRSKKTN